MERISASVGFGGSNVHSDVATVQTLLKTRGVDPGRVDGQCGPKTIDAIARSRRASM
jgi:peptidoglycan hydrolase-like protein with peptidoglycan-binding domain